MVERGRIAVSRQVYSYGRAIKVALSSLALAAALLSMAGCSQDQAAETNEASARNTQALIQKGERHYSAGRFRASVIEARNAVQLNPNEIEGYVLISKVFNALSQGKLALQELDKYQGEKNFAFGVQQVKALLNLKKYHSAQNMISQLPVGATDVEKAELEILKAQTSFGLQTFDNAEKYYLQAQSLSKGDVKLSIASLVGLAKVAAVKGDEKKTLQFLEQSLSIQENSEALLLQGILALNSSRIDDAEELFSSALMALPVSDVMIPERVRVLTGLTNILIQQGRSAEALVYSKILADANPMVQEMKIKFTEAIDSYKRGDLVNAEGLLDDLYKQSGKSSDLGGTMLGMVSYAQGDFEKANTFFNEHLDPETASADLLKAWAGSELQLNRPEKAAQILQQKLELTPDDAELLSLLSLVSLVQDDYSGALKTVEKAIEIDPSKEQLRLTLAQYLNSNQRPLKALEQLEKAFDNSGSNADIQNRYLRQLLVMERDDKAWSVAQSLAKQYPTVAQTSAAAGGVAFKLKKYEAAKNYFNDALALQDGLASAKLGIAELHFVQKDFEGASKAFAKVIESSPEQIHGYRGLVSSAIQLDTVDQALAVLTAKGEQSKDLAAPIAVRAGYSLKLGEIEQAIELGKQALERDKTFSFAKKVLVAAYFRGGVREASAKNYAEARKSILEAVRIEPGNMRLLGVLAEIEIKAGEHNEAAKIISQIEALFPDAAATDILKGDLGIAKQLLSEAESSYLSGWESQPSDLLGRKLYELYLGKNEPEKANRILQQWRQRLPKSGTPILFMALDKQKQQDFPGAIGLYEELIILTPVNVLAFNNLAWLYSEVGDQRALATAEKAYNLAPENGAVADTYGWLLVGKGKLTQGINVLEKAVGHAPNNLEIQGHLDQAREQL